MSNLQSSDLSIYGTAFSAWLAKTILLLLILRIFAIFCSFILWLFGFIRGIPDFTAILSFTLLVLEKNLALPILLSDGSAFVAFYRKKKRTAFAVLFHCPATTYSHRGKPPITIGAEELNFRVRDGNGCDLFAIVTGQIRY